MQPRQDSHGSAAGCRAAARAAARGPGRREAPCRAVPRPYPIEAPTGWLGERRGAELLQELVCLGRPRSGLGEQGSHTEPSFQLRAQLPAKSAAPLHREMSFFKKGWGRNK